MTSIPVIPECPGAEPAARLAESDLLDAARTALAAIELLGAAARNQTDVTDAQLAACVNAAGDGLRAAIARAEATGHA